VTRVASGCKDEAEAAALTRTFEEQILTIPTGADRFHLHLTPDYSTTVLPGTNYHFFNKPLGLRHWMKEGLGFPENLSNYKDVVFIILDPDQIILRPFTTTDFGNDPTVRWSQGASQLHEDYVVTEGRPFSQEYRFGAYWVRDVNVDVQRVVQAALNATGSSADASDSSHLYHWTEEEVFQSYMGGPPYIAVPSDMYKIISTWSAVVAPVYELTRNHLSEMYAYSTAAAHVELPHTLAYSFMLSNPDIEEEGWEMVDELEPEQVCQHVSSDSSNPEDVAWRETLPHILHYCQPYALGPYFFSKHYLPNTLLTCEHPLMVDPAEEDTIVQKYNYSLLPDGTHNEISPVVRKRQAFFLCHLVARINEASVYWKEQHCKTEEANFRKDFAFPKR
jgi:peptidyl serine alpha-galactosyltransferase